ncbi:DNA-dependent RNA polymerase subunit epsilon [Bacillus sp. FJAT-45350]|uniref:DNA-dependent RNA polymerase subunit epsilon n=1 Tax=Bacillus sp. FJAT-45350 TaxID=2011014 RepID=UPI000BB6AFF9|nr:DNA-directed RNA polymerase subunit epsilon [Bacillus sp. FJAT-45350]
MIFKVFFQESIYQSPVRENTKAIYVEGVSESDVRLKLADRNYNIEFIRPVSGEYLEYEQQHEDFKVEKI